MSKDTQVLVVGAGPIGLIKIWGMKCLNPNLKIVVLEKYPEYQRSHTLILQWQKLEAVMKAAHSENEPVLVNLLERLKKDPHIRTNELQQIFTQLVIDSGVEILIKHEVKEETIQPMLAGTILLSSYSLVLMVQRVLLVALSFLKIILRNMSLILYYNFVLTSKEKKSQPMLRQVVFIP